MATRAPAAGLSSNPALAAIQRAKLESQGSLGNASTGRGSMDQARPLASAISYDSTGTTARGPQPNFQAEQAKRLAEESETSMLKEGWWAKTDAGNLNIIDDKKKASSAFVPSGMTQISNKLDFSSMFNRDEPAAEAPAAPPSQPEAAPASGVSQPEAASLVEGIANLIIAPEEKAQDVASPAAARPHDEEGGGWWTKMDNKTLNEKDVAVAMGTKSVFQPQFVGNSGLTNKLDFSRAADE